MIDQSKAGNHEVAGAETKDGRIIVFAEKGNILKESKNYVQKDDAANAVNGQVQVLMNNKLYSVSVNANGYIPNDPIWER